MKTISSGEYCATPYEPDNSNTVRSLLCQANQWISRSSFSTSTLLHIRKWSGATGKTRTENRWSVKAIIGPKAPWQETTSGIALKGIKSTLIMLFNGSLNQRNFTESACLCWPDHNALPKLNESHWPDRTHQPSSPGCEGTPNNSALRAAVYAWHVLNLKAKP